MPACARASSCCVLCVGNGAPVIVTDIILRTIAAINNVTGRGRAIQTSDCLVHFVHHAFACFRTHPVVRPPSVQARRRALSSSDQAAETNAQLSSLHEVSAAADLAALGRRSEAAPLLERAVEICAGSMGQDSALTRAAVHRYSCADALHAW